MLGLDARVIWRRTFEPVRGGAFNMVRSHRPGGIIVETLAAVKRLGAVGLKNVGGAAVSLKVYYSPLSVLRENVG